MFCKSIETVLSNLDTIVKKSGQLIYCTDSRSIYLDTSDKARVLFDEIIRLKSEEERESLIAPLINKIYLIDNENPNLYIYNYESEKWIKISENILQIASDTLLGGVKSSTEVDKIRVDTDGTMCINKINYSNILKVPVTKRGIHLIIANSDNQKIFILSSLPSDDIIIDNLYINDDRLGFSKYGYDNVNPSITLNNSTNIKTGDSLELVYWYKTLSD